MACRVRVLLWCCLVTTVAVTACAGDGRVEPDTLELRDVLGIAPEAALAWDAPQRASARRVLDAGMRVRQPTAQAVSPIGGVAGTLAAADRERDRESLGALGVVALGPRQATARQATLAPRRAAATPVVVQLAAAWAEHPRWATLPARGLDVLATIAWDAGHRSGPVVVAPAPQLAVIAAYVPGSPATLVVNPVLLAALEPVAPTAGPTPTVVVALDPIGNPYGFYASIAECADAQQARCAACVADGSCDPLVAGDDGAADCATLAADPGRGYALACINFALAIEPIASCTTAAAAACPVVPDARLELEKNADFLDHPDCAAALDRCLDDRYGAQTQTAPPPSDTSPSCADSSSSGCGEACASSSSDGCDNTSSDSSCSSSDSSGDSCSSSDSSGGDCSGGGDSSGCADAGDSGGDCSGGGGSDCNVAPAGPHERDHRFLWALLPLPFAVIARRRADRRRAAAAKAVAP